MARKLPRDCDAATCAEQVAQAEYCRPVVWHGHQPTEVAVGQRLALELRRQIRNVDHITEGMADVRSGHCACLLRAQAVEEAPEVLIVEGHVCRQASCQEARVRDPVAALVGLRERGGQLHGLGLREAAALHEAARQVLDGHLAVAILAKRLEVVDPSGHPLGGGNRGDGAQDRPLQRIAPRKAAEALQHLRVKGLQVLLANDLRKPRVGQRTLGVEAQPDVDLEQLRHEVLGQVRDVAPPLGAE
mmetsp:Transcript_53475/g.124334  ORF Transcript_53475/g.124334 Transcript_53475/m.124334 type:complete len:245 (-) Transcript_53475:879-1613(-)